MKLYFRYAAIILKGQMQHKASFVMTTAGHFLVTFTTFLGVWIMFGRFGAVKGFLFTEVLLCYSVVLASFTLAECFFRGFDAFSGIISKGEFDRILLRPRNEIFQVVCSRIEFSRLGRLAQAAVILAVALPASGIGWSAAKIATLVFMLFGGVAVFTGLFILYAGICFFTTEGLEFMNIFTDGGREFGKYPLSVYGDGVLRLLTYVVPLALFQYYPFLYLTGRSDNPLFIFLPLLSALFLLPCLLFWRVGLRHYKSTGS